MVEHATDDTISFSALERQAWTARAHAYDAWLGTVTTGAVTPLLDAVGAGRGTHLLDVACGPGYGAAAAAQRGAVAIGVDFAPTMVAEAERRFPGIAFHEGDAEHLGFEDGVFDAVICGFALLHMGDPERAITEAWRVLKPGGRYAFTVWATPDRHDLFRLVLDAIAAHGRMDVGLPPAPSLFRFAAAGECRRTLAAAGFADPVVHEVPLAWRAGSADAVLDMLYKSTVRTVLLLERQRPEDRERIHAAIRQGAEQFRQNGGYRLALPAVLAAARKP